MQPGERSLFWSTRAASWLRVFLRQLGCLNNTHVSRCFKPHEETMCRFCNPSLTRVHLFKQSYMTTDSFKFIVLCNDVYNCCDEILMSSSLGYLFNLDVHYSLLFFSCFSSSWIAVHVERIFCAFANLFCFCVILKIENHFLYFFSSSQKYEFKVPYVANLKRANIQFSSELLCRPPVHMTAAILRGP